MPATRKRRIQDEVAQRALQAAELRYGGQRGALAALLASTEAQAKTDAEQAFIAGRMLQADAKQAVPRMQGIYGDAQRQAGEANSFLVSELAKLGPAADPYRLAAKVGSTGATTRLAGAGARASADLVQRQLDAGLGSVQQRRSIRGQTPRGQAEDLRADSARTNVTRPCSPRPSSGTSATTRRSGRSSVTRRARRKRTGRPSKGARWRRTVGWTRSPGSRCRRRPSRRPPRGSGRHPRSSSRRPTRSPRLSPRQSGCNARG